MNILITGASGQLGRTLSDISAGYDHKCFFTDVLPGEGVLHLDVTEESEVLEFMRTHAVDVVINCAGYTDVNKAESDEEKARLLNVHAPEVLASSAAKTGAVLIHISTDYVYDGQASTPYRETDSAGPLNIYAKTKLEGDMAVAGSGCRYLIFRTAWLYSCYGRNFFKTIEDKASKTPGIKVVFDQVGAPTYAYDLALAIFCIIDDGRLDNCGIYHFSDEGVCSWYDFAKAIVRGFGYTCNVQPCRSDEFPSPVRRPAYSVLDKSLFKKTFGYEVPHWEDSLELCIKEYKKRF